MTTETNVKVGILTYGKPQIAKNEEPDSLVVTNAMMGEKFHWQRTYKLILPQESKIVNRKPLVAEIPLEKYLESVVGSEMNPLAHREFLRAHAIVSRSWVWGKIMHTHDEGCNGQLSTMQEIRTWADTGTHTGFHVCNDDHCQRFQGVQPIDESLLEALQSTKGMVLADSNGTVIDARFSKCCGGRTELFSTCWQDVDYPYLQSISDPWCNPEILPEGLLATIMKDYDASTTPDYYRWTETVSCTDIETRLRDRFNITVGKVTDIAAVDRGPSGRISRLRIHGTEGQIYIGKELAIRRLLGKTHLLSSAFHAEHAPGGFRLQGRGWGHGVGMCQIGAAVMAHYGKTAEEILTHYYPGSHILTT